MKVHGFLVVASLACCKLADADASVCNPLFEAFLYDPSFCVDVNIATSVINNQSPILINPKGGKFRCANVETSCCSEPVMDCLEQELTETWEWMLGTIDGMRNMTRTLGDGSDRLKIQFDEGLGKLKDAYNRMPESPEKNDLGATMKLLEDLVLILKLLADDTVAWVSNSVGAYERCLRRVLHYNAGLTCLACDQNWLAYIDYSATSVKVKFAKNTCDVVEHSCGGIWDAAEIYMGKVRVHVISALDAALLDSSNVPAIVTTSQLCEDQPCRQYVCENMLNGFLFTPPMNRLAIASTYVALGLGRMGEAFWKALTSTNQRRAITEVSHHERQVLNSADQLAQTAAEMLDLLSNVSPLGSTDETTQIVRRNSGAKFVAVYDSNDTGYDAVAVGERDSPVVLRGLKNGSVRAGTSVTGLICGALMMVVMGL